MLAAYHGHAAAVSALLERGADADRANDRGQTPLAGAVFKGEGDVIRALLPAARIRRRGLRPPSTPPGCSARPNSWNSSEPGERALNPR